MRFDWLKRRERLEQPAPVAEADLSQLSDRVLTDLGLSAPAVDRFTHAPVEVSNDRV